MLKPWTNAELYKIPPLDWKDILEMDLNTFKESIVDESQIKENEISDKSDSETDWRFQVIVIWFGDNTKE